MDITTNGVFIIGPPWGNTLSVLAAIRSPTSLSTGLSAFLFENQWLYWLIAAGIAATCWELARRRTDSRLRNAAVAVAALTLLWMLAAFAVITPRERLYAAHQGFAHAVKEADVTKIVSYLAPSFRSVYLDVDGTPDSRPIRAEIEQRLKTYGVKETYITSYASDIAGKGAFTHVTLLTQTETIGPIKSSWTLNWEDLPGQDWKIVEADLVRLGDENISR